jgi:hypothetical protein
MAGRGSSFGAMAALRGIPASYGTRMVRLSRRLKRSDDASGGLGAEMVIVQTVEDELEHKLSK